ncbi:MAG TPA: hypothetical protein VGN17_12490 [Bryobacteraceae bacterium]|jgi:hypothetical protein
MHTRRLAAFLLGIWLGCSVLMMWFQFSNPRFTADLLITPSDSAAEMTKRLPDAELRLMLRYAAAEQNRRYQFLWEQVELGLAVATGLALVAGTQKKILPLAICGAMLLTVVFQHMGVTPELAYRGRLTDFPPGNNSTGAMLRVYALEQVYAWVEGTKLVAGVVLASYLFVFRPRRNRKQLHAIDDRDHSRVAG